MTEEKSGRRKLLLLAALFLGPLFVAYALYYFSDWRPSGTVNKGHLLNPARPLPKLALTLADGTPVPADELKRIWTMLYVGTSNCAEECRKALYNARQVHTALGKEAHRVQGVFIVTDDRSLASLQNFLHEEHRGMKLWTTELAARIELMVFLGSTGMNPEAPGNIYLVDPLGNWVMYYLPSDEPKGMLKDLKKLLRLSRVG